MSATDSQKSIWSFLEKFKLSIILGLIGIILIGAGILLPSLNLFKSEPEFIKASQPQETQQVEIMVDVAGAVKNPDVYSLKEGSRIQDAIKSAGGLAKSADGAWIAKNLNLAQLIGDGTKIYIPKVGEIETSSTGNGDSLGTASETTSGLININTASISELDTLPRIGPVTAQKIIDGRPYSSVEDLSTKDILGPKTYEGVKDLVSVQ